MYASSRSFGMQYVHFVLTLTQLPIGRSPLCIPILTNCGDTPRASAASVTVTLFMSPPFILRFRKLVSKKNAVALVCGHGQHLPQTLNFTPGKVAIPRHFAVERWRIDTHSPCDLFQSHAHCNDLCPKQISIEHSCTPFQLAFTQAIITLQFPVVNTFSQVNFAYYQKNIAKMQR